MGVVLLAGGWQIAQGTRGEKAVGVYELQEEELGVESEELGVRSEELGVRSEELGED